MSPTAYTPLESLLLFQALRCTTQIDATSFIKISEDLKKVPLVTADPNYEAGRLSPDALRDLYLWLLKEEAKKDLDKRLDAEDAVQSNGDVVGSPGGRKRKSPNPSLPTVREAAQHAHLIPQLVSRLYARFRDSAVRQIREQERRHVALSVDVKEIEQGLWDEKLQNQNSAVATDSPKPSTSAHTHRVTAQEPNRDHGSPEPVPAGPLPKAHGQRLEIEPPNRLSPAKIEPIVNHGTEPPSMSDVNGGQEHHHRRTSSSTTLPLLSEMAPKSPGLGIPPKIPSGQQVQGASHASLPSPPAIQRSPYAQPPPLQQQQQQQQHLTYPSQNAHSPQLSHTLSRPSSSPRPILPPPGMVFPGPQQQQQQARGSPHGSPGMQRPPQMLPQQQYANSPSQYQQQRHPSGSTTPSNVRSSYQQTPHAQGPSAYYQPQLQHAYGDRRQGYAQQPPPQFVAQQPHSGGYMLPPFQVAPQDPAKAQQQQQQQNQQHQQNQQNQQQPTVPANQAQSQQPLYGSARSAQQPILQSQRTPPYQGRPPAGTVTNTPPHPPPQLLATVPRLQPALSRRVTEEIIPNLGTPPRRQPLTPGGREKPLWKSERQQWPAPAPGSPTQPLVEPLSPVQVKARPISRRSLSPSQARKGGRARRSASAQASESDRPSSRKSVKDESSSPARIDDDAGERQDQTATPPPMSTRRTNRNRRSTLQGVNAASQRRNKASVAEPSVSATPEPPPPPPPAVPHGRVLAVRNFNKMTAVIMEEVGSHKHGIYFKQPVEHKGVAGYSEIIKLPQDLKSIKSAIVAGARAVAATAVNETPGASKGAMVELDKTEDVVPPKAIVNGAQLQKEVTRMFANAVMFNPGEDGIVADAREMSDDVEPKIADWRGAGVNGPGDSADDDGGADVEDGRVKRRKG